jgi:16S rRNA (guanine966-N2)-methyltransferase
VRETLFNWLRDEIEGARCLDLYAGSGALGFEAASRGAAEVVLVEVHPLVAKALRTNCAVLEATRIQVLHEGALDFLKREPAPFDVVFLDPPFRKGWLRLAAERLERAGWLSADALIYLESERELPRHDLPSSWTVRRQGTAGEVAYGLYQRNHPLSR